MNNGGITMAFLGELLTYSFKYIVLLAVTIVAVICGIKYKKNKIAKAAAEVDAVDTKDAESEN